MIFTVYLDESGNPDDPKTQDFVLAGYVARDDQWTSFGIEWKLALAKFGIPFFHMSDFAAKRSYYRQWTGAEREARYETLANIINTHTICSIGIIISGVDYAAAMGSIAPMIPSGIYGYMFRLFPIAVRRILGDEGYTDPQIVYVLDRKRGSGAGVALMGQIVSLLDEVALENGKELNPLGYLSAKTEDKQRFVPLQAADILAYQLYRDGTKYHHRFRDGRLSKHLNMLRTKDSHWERWTESEISYSMSKSRDIRMDLLRRMRR